MTDYANNTGANRPQGRGGRGHRRPGGPRGNSSYSNRDRFEPKREPKKPEPSGFQKFLHKVTFGLLGKASNKPAYKSSSRPEPIRTERTDRPNRADRSDRPDRPARENRPPRQSPTSAEVTTEKLYVGNLSYDASESDLFELFKGAGRVNSAEVVVNNRTQRSKGFAFVTMMSVDEAKKAVAELNGKPFMGRPLIVGGAKPMPDREEREERGEHNQVADDDVITRPKEDLEESSH